MRTLTNKGFTLIELMIVVACIGIMVAIAIPKLQHVFRHSHNIYIIMTPSGKEVRCQNGYSRSSGYECSECDDGATYHNVQNVREVEVQDQR